MKPAAMHYLSLDDQALILDALLYVTTPGAERLHALLQRCSLLIEHKEKCDCESDAKEQR